MIGNAIVEYKNMFIQLLLQEFFDNKSNVIIEE